MVKVKEVVVKKSKKKSRITVKSLMLDVRKKYNERQVKVVTKMLEEKYDNLQDAKRIVKKIETQIKQIENMDIKDIEVEEYDYSED